MHTKKVLGGLVCALAALATGLVPPAAAQGGPELDVIDVFIFDPEADVSNVAVLPPIFTPGRRPPESLPLPIAADASVPPSDLNVDSVDFGLDGLVGILDVWEGSEFSRGLKIGEGALDSVWSGVLNLARAEAFYGIDTLLGPVSATLRAFARADMYYGRNHVTDVTEVPFDDLDGIEIILDVRDAVEVDADGNGKPDASALLAEPAGLIATSIDGFQVTTDWIALDTLGPGGLGDTLVHLRRIVRFYTLDFDIDVAAPTLQQLQGASGAGPEIMTATDARLVITLARGAVHVVDNSAGFDAALFDLTGPNGSPLPSPRPFVLINILLLQPHDIAEPTPQWIALQQLPGGLSVELRFRIFRRNRGSILANEHNVFAVAFPTSFVQIGEALLDDAQINGRWLDVGDPRNGLGSVIVTNELLDPDSVRAGVQPGDDTIRVSLNRGSLLTGFVLPILYGSVVDAADDAAEPPATGGGGSCFIATAAYGTPLAADINVLRALRDHYMLSNAFGTAFTDTYYRLSPPVADAVANHASLRAVVRTLLAIVVILSRFVLAAPGASVVLLLLAGTLSIWKSALHRCSN